MLDTQKVELLLGYQLKRAQTALEALMATRLKPLGITVAQYAVLTGVHEAPGCSSAELARRAFVTPQASNQLVKALERSGLVCRSASPDHGRVLQTRLTPRGRRLLQRARAHIADVETLLAAGMTERGREQVTILLSSAADRMHAALPPGPEPTRHPPGRR